MARRLAVYVVDDSPTQIDIARALLEKAGHAVASSASSAVALREIPAQRPDCVLVDIMMPEIDGHELLRRLRAMPELDRTRLVVMSSKAFPFDRRRAADMGADGYFVKPLAPASFVTDLERVVAGTLALAFWGVRGTLPVSRADTVRYGGNTMCVSLTFPDGRLFVLDAGTGIKALSDALVAARRSRIEGHILVSHPHWDHINALPFFAPFFTAGNQFEICGPAHGNVTMRDLISAQMNGVYFPITVRDFAADVVYRDLVAGHALIGGVGVRTMLLQHPGNCLGYRLEPPGRSICYVTDNELYPPDAPSYSEDYVQTLSAFCLDADVLITDCCYTDEEYPRKMHWGHSSVSQVADLARRARVKTLYLVHHDPDQGDAAIDAKLAQARALLAGWGAATQVQAPAQGTEVEV